MVPALHCEHFLANRNERTEKATVTFRQASRHPELWNPVDGSQRDLSEFTIKGAMKDQLEQMARALRQRLAHG